MYVDWEAVREMQEEEGAKLGDPRRCAVHGEVTSSPDGMFDGVCGACEMGEDEPGEEVEDLGPSFHEADAAYWETAADLMAERCYGPYD